MTEGTLKGGTDVGEAWCVSCMAVCGRAAAGGEKGSASRSRGRRALQSLVVRADPCLSRFAPVNRHCNPRIELSSRRYRAPMQKEELTQPNLGITTFRLQHALPFVIPPASIEPSFFCSVRTVMVERDPKWLKVATRDDPPRFAAVHADRWVGWTSLDPELQTISQAGSAHHVLLPSSSTSIGSALRF